MDTKETQETTKQIDAAIQQYVFDEDSVLYDVLDNMSGFRVEGNPQAGWCIVGPNGLRGRLVLQWTLPDKPQ